MRMSRNVRVTAVEVPYDENRNSSCPVSQAVTIAGEPVRIEIDSVATGWIGSDKVTLRICR